MNKSGLLHRADRRGLRADRRLLENIYFWLSNQLWKILLLAAVFGGGWLLGRFGGKKNGTQQGNGN